MTSYEVGCHTTANTDECDVYEPFTLTQGPGYARFTTTLPGQSTKSVMPPLA